MDQIPQREHWSGPVKGGDVFTLTKERGTTSPTAVCELWSHPFGWELRLLVGGELRRSQVCRSPREWLDTRDEWHTAMLAAGWR